MKSVLLTISLLVSTAAANELFPYDMDRSAIPPPLIHHVAPPRVVDMLIQELYSKPTLQRRIELVRDLGMCEQSAAAVQSVIAAMSDPESAVRAQAAVSASAMGDNSALAPLRALLADADPTVRREAVAAGVALHEASFITGGLDDQDETVFVVACALARTAEHDAKIAARLKTLSPRARATAIRNLGRRKASAQAAAIADQLGSGDVALTIAAIEVLGQLNDVSAIPRVQSFLQHDHPSVRRAAVMALAALYAPQAKITMARRMIDDADLTVREAAARIFIANPSAGTETVLIAQLVAGYRPLHHAARDALVATALLPSQPAIDAAVSMLSDADPRRREDGSFILGRIKSSASLDRHIQLLKEKDWSVVKQAAESLGLIGRSEAGPELARVAAAARRGDDFEGIEPPQMEAIGAAFIGCAKLRYRPAFALARPVVSKKMTCPMSVRGPAIWAAGVLGASTDEQLASEFLSIARDTTPYESEAARFESLKAIGNLGCKLALADLQEIVSEEPVPSLRWMAHESADRLAGRTNAVYDPPKVTLAPDTSIQDLPASTSR